MKKWNLCWKKRIRRSIARIEDDTVTLATDHHYNRASMHARGKVIHPALYLEVHGSIESRPSTIPNSLHPEPTYRNP